MSVFGGLLPAFGLHMETYRVSPRIHAEVEKYGPDQPRMRTRFTQWTSEHCNVIVIPLYCKFTVVSWLNDSQVVLFHIMREGERERGREGERERGREGERERGRE